ncbi:Putative BTB/POZ domain-containing protein [Septoria linicola]|uniref:BTB/POZ domain-containing protein n=1 Tax=Septoria linicola TaxID=215465 RepID=A0A9Q9ASK7_9PEZI|nr:Putative BTB/POZ domain-containing protein [Septoria linicola]
MADDNTKAAVCNGMAKLFDRPDLADFTIVCGGTQWQVNQIVLSLQSPVFEKVCNGEFLETKQRKIDVSEHDPTHVESLVNYLYSSRLCFHVEMCVLADKYDIQGLVKLSATKFELLVNSTSSPAEIAPAAAIAYEAASVTKAIRKNLIAHVIKQGLFSYATKCEELEMVMKEYPEFAIDMARAMSNLSSWLHPPTANPRQFKCTNCAKTFDWYMPGSQAAIYSCPGCEVPFSGRHWRASAVDVPALAE